MTEDTRAIGIANQGRRNAAISKVIEMLQTDMDIESNSADHKSAAKIAMFALEAYEDKMNDALDKEYGSEPKVFYVPVVRTVHGEQEGQAYNSYKEAEASINRLKAAYGKAFVHVIITKRYV